MNDNELASLRIRKATKQLENLIREQKRKSHDAVIKEQTPHASAKTKPVCDRKRITVNDIYENKLASVKNNQKEWPLHPDKVNRLYHQHQLCKEWKKKCSPSYCRSCLKDKWKSTKVHKRPQTRFIYDRKHRPGKFISRNFEEKSKKSVG